MKKISSKIIFAFIFTFIIITSILCVTVFSAEDNTSGVTFKGTINNDKESATITGVTISANIERTKEFKIPATISIDGKEYKVTKINSSAFKDNKKVFGKLTLPDGLEEIGSSAFHGTYIYGDIVIPDSVKDVTNENGVVTTPGIGSNAFYNCYGIQSVKLSKNITVLPDNVFYQCHALTEIDTSSITSFGANCFYKCYALLEVNLSKATVIKDRAFFECKSLHGNYDISKIEEPNGQNNLGVEIFKNCVCIESLVMPNCEFDLNIIAGCTSIKSLVVPDSNDFYTSIDGVIFDNDVKTLLLYPLNKSDEIYTLPESVITIDKTAFANALKIEKVVLPNNLEFIGDGAFSGSSLKSIVITDKVKYISVDTFKSCSKLEWVIFGENIITVGVDSFKGCSGNVVIISKSEAVTKPDYISESNFYYLKDYNCTEHFYGYNDKEPTCTEFGYETCVLCGKSTYYKELGHSGPIIKKHELTCTADAYVEYNCIRCNEKNLIKTLKHHTGHKGAIISHEYGDSSTPTYTVFKCNICMETYIGNYTPFGDSDSCSNAHDGKSNVASRKITDGGCATNGLTIKWCKDCGYSYESDVTPKEECKLITVDHIQSSCYAKGQIIEECTKCKTRYYTELDYAEHAHNWYTVDDVKGYEYSTCSVEKCGYFETRKVDYSKLNSLIAQISPYYEVWYSQETVAVIKPIIEAQSINMTQETVDYNVNLLRNTLANIKYNVSDVPVVFIEKTEGNLSKDYSGAKIVVAYIDENGVQQVEASEIDGEIKIRGNSTANPNKYPYNIKFSSKVDLFDMGAGKKYCLLANLFDQTLMRNAIAIEFAQSLGLEYTPKYEFAEVYYNNNFQGLYMITTPMDIDDNRIAIDDEEEFVLELENKGDGALYVTSPIFGSKFLVDQPDFEDLSYKSYSALYSSFYVIDYAILSGNWNEIQKYVDVDSMAKYFLVHEYIKEVDITYDSTRFFLKDSKNEDGTVTKKIYGGPIWDFDLSMGNVGDKTDGGNSSTHNLYLNKEGYVTEGGIQGNPATGKWVSTNGSTGAKFYVAFLWNNSKDFQKKVCDLIANSDFEMRILYEDIEINERGDKEINTIDKYNKDEDFTAARVRNYQKYVIAQSYSSLSHIEYSYADAIKYMRSFLQNRHAWIIRTYLSETE